ncbi:hypothetical protein C7S18_03610 [Ahniella affigens]|uniref:LysM domain-containing protein n=1 Tax=Ahniella affigens TaxID=2021234 RepID=A0A2P1PNA5_9GAMM|nr:transglycosylase SLT domain-containing protein [Ahniella affigens]AVP96330.1 hypothetical protein C7S18_03610 [Ahniella affigens]
MMPEYLICNGARSARRDVTRVLFAFALIMLGACAAPVARPDIAATQDSPSDTAPPLPERDHGATTSVVNDETSPADMAAVAIHQDSLEPDPSAPLPPPDFWNSVRQELVFTRCSNEDALSSRWTRKYAGYPARFQETLNQISPLMQYVARELRAANLPIDFIFLPIVESTYHPHRSRGDWPAGIWQLMPQTARGFGAPMKAQYDGRLDFAQSTFAAMKLLNYLSVQFDQDWKLVNMAFNAGEYRVKRALKGPKGTLLPEPKGLSPITIEHYAKLRALGCLIDQPERFNLTLPPLDPGRELASVNLPEAWPLDFLAHLLKMDVTALHKLNPGLYGTHTPGFPEYRLLLPKFAEDDLLAALAPLSPTYSARWQQVQLADADARAKAALEAGLSQEVYARVNSDGSAKIWLPTGSGQPKVLASDGASAAERHRVRAGDTLWGIARHYRVKVQSLIEWNGLGKKALIKPGQWLRLRARD